MHNARPCCFRPGCRRAISGRAAWTRWASGSSCWAALAAAGRGRPAGAIAGGIVWFALAVDHRQRSADSGALVAAAVVAIEVLLATEALGPAYERIDILAVERAE